MGTAVNIENSLGYTNKRRGTPQYMAPEIKNKKSDEMIDATIADVYSLGVCLHLLLTGEFPCQSTFDSDMSSVETETSGDPNLPESDKVVKARMQFLSESAKDLLEEMLEESPFFRISLDEVFQHSFFTEFSVDNIQHTVYEEMSHRLDFIKSGKLKGTK